MRTLFQTKEIVFKVRLKVFKGHASYRPRNVTSVGKISITSFRIISSVAKEALIGGAETFAQQSGLASATQTPKTFSGQRASLTGGIKTKRQMGSILLEEAENWCLRSGLAGTGVSCKDVECSLTSCTLECTCFHKKSQALESEEIEKALGLF